MVSPWFVRHFRSPFGLFSLSPRSFLSIPSASFRYSSVASSIPLEPFFLPSLNVCFLSAIPSPPKDYVVDRQRECRSFLCLFPAIICGLFVPFSDLQFRANNNKRRHLPPLSLSSDIDFYSVCTFAIILLLRMIYVLNESVFINSSDSVCANCSMNTSKGSCDFSLSITMSSFFSAS